MARDIDDIIERLQCAIPDARIEQLQVKHPADDDGLWFISVPGKPGEVQIESSYGVCPFLIESSYNDKRHTGATVEEVVAIVRAILA
jgi:hypothetical protein